MALDTDPRDLKLDRQNDLVITTDLQWTRGVEAVMQDCRIVLQMFQGEWFLNRAAGIPYWGRILRERPDVAQRAARDLLRQVAQRRKCRRGSAIGRAVHRCSTHTHCSLEGAL